MNSYDEVKSIFFNACYSYCRNKNLVSKGKIITWSDYESEHGFAYDALTDSFGSPVEDLMLEVITLVADAGRAPEQTEKYHKNIISNMLLQHSLTELLSHVSEEDRKDISYDMSLLGFIDNTACVAIK